MNVFWGFVVELIELRRSWIFEGVNRRPRVVSREVGFGPVKKPLQGLSDEGHLIISAVCAAIAISRPMPIIFHWVIYWYFQGHQDSGHAEPRNLLYISDPERLWIISHAVLVQGSHFGKVIGSESHTKLHYFKLQHLVRKEYNSVVCSSDQLDNGDARLKWGCRERARI